MKAMILAAGLGTRLKPLTNTIPKALVPVGGVPILEHVITKLIDAHITSIVVNTHYHAEQVEIFLKERNFSIPIQAIYEPELLDTAGGIANAYKYLQDTEPIIIHNVDILSEIPLKDLYAFHKKTNADVTLAVRSVPLGAHDRPFLVDKNDYIIGHLNRNKSISHIFRSGEWKKEYAFCCIHVMSQSFLRELASHNQKGKSITIRYLEAIAKGTDIHAWDIGEKYFYKDIGKPHALAEARSWVDQL